MYRLSVHTDIDVHGIINNASNLVASDIHLHSCSGDHQPRCPSLNIFRNIYQDCDPAQKNRWQVDKVDIGLSIAQQFFHV